MVDHHPGFQPDSLVGRRDPDGNETDFEVVRSAPEGVRVVAPVRPDLVVAFLAGMSAYLESDAQLLPCAADVADQAALERVIKLIRRHYLKEDV